MSSSSSKDHLLSSSATERHYNAPRRRWTRDVITLTRTLGPGVTGGRVGLTNLIWNCPSVSAATFGAVIRTGDDSVQEVGETLKHWFRLVSSRAETFLLLVSSTFLRSLCVCFFTSFFAPMKQTFRFCGSGGEVKWSPAAPCCRWGAKRLWKPSGKERGCGEERP